MNELDHGRVREELPAYLLGALDADRTAELERHLDGCEECRTELTWLRPAAQLLPESVERVEPPPDLRGRIMAEVRADAAPDPVEATGFWARTGSWLRPGGLRFAAGLAVLVVLAGVVAGYAIRGGDSDGGETTVVAGKAPGVTAKMVSEGSSGTLRLANVERLSADEALQAWVQRGERVERAGPLFVAGRDGTATTEIGDMQGVSTVMVTTEPRGGSTSPTSEPLVSIAVPQ